MTQQKRVAVVLGTIKCSVRSGEVQKGRFSSIMKQNKKAVEKPRRLSCFADFQPSTDQGGGKRRAVISQHGFRLGGPPQEFPYQSLCSAFNQAQNEQQNNRTDEGVDNRGNKTAPDYNAELRQQPTSDEAADYSDDDIPDKPVTAAFDQHTSKPTGDGTDNKPNNECLNVHLPPHVLARTGCGPSPL